MTLVAGVVFAVKPPMNYDGNPGGVKLLEQGQRPAVVYPTVEAQQAYRRRWPRAPRAATASFNDLGADAGITIVEGHELAETSSGQFPSAGRLDSDGSENGDKCAWISSGQGALANVTFPDGNTYPVQSLWSNAFNSGAGGCVLSY